MNMTDIADLNRKSVCKKWIIESWGYKVSISDQNIKQEYSASQLLEYYNQGLELQSRLVELYHERQGEDGR